MSETHEVIEYGPSRPSNPWPRRMGGAVAVMVIGSTYAWTQQHTGTNDPTLRHPTPTEVRANTKNSFVYGPGHNELLFTPKASRLVITRGYGQERHNTTLPVSVSFDGLRCRDSKVYGKLAVERGHDTTDFVPLSPLPENSLSMDCLIDNQLSAPGIGKLVIAGASYNYVIAPRATAAR